MFDSSALVTDPHTDEPSLAIASVNALIALMLHDLISPFTALSMGCEMMQDQTHQEQMLPIMLEANENLRARFEYLRCLFSPTASMPPASYHKMIRDYVKSYRHIDFSCDDFEHPWPTSHYRLLMLATLWVLKQLNTIKTLHISLNASSAYIKGDALAKPFGHEKALVKHLEAFFHVQLRENNVSFERDQAIQNCWHMHFSV
ncbi:MAG: hypothetical protein V6Z78_00615 [Holosporaceae bacterium]